MDNIMNIMDNIEYGYFDINGKKHIDVDEKFCELYKLQSPDETLKNRIGVCWDQVELERLLFEKQKLEFKTYFIVYYDNNKSPTHTFLIYKKNEKYYWFEHSWEKYKGIREYETEQEALKDIRKKFIINELKNDYNLNNLYIYEYNKPNYGIGVLEFYKHCENGNKIICRKC